MLSYAHTRMWLMHATLDTDKMEADLASPKSIRLADLVPGEPSDGCLVASQRIRGENDAAGHDIYPSLDLTFDSAALGAVSRRFFGDLRHLRLGSLLLRINDWGFLQILAVFETEEQEYKKIENDGVLATRDLNRTMEAIQPVFADLEKRGWIRLPSDVEWGVPVVLKGAKGFDWTDTYLYSDHLLVAQEPEETQKQLIAEIVGEEKPLAMGEGIEVHSPWGTPVWISPKPFRVEDWLYSLSGENLLLAETLCYTAGTQCYQVLLENFFLSNRPSAARPEAKNSLPRIASQQLLKLIIRNNVVIQKAIARRAVLDNHQGNYYNRCREHFPQDNPQVFREAEKIVKIAVQVRENEEKERTSRFVQAILFFFTSLTLYSVIVDISSFFQGEPGSYSFSLARLGMIALATAMLGIMYFAIHRSSKSISID